MFYFNEHLYLLFDFPLIQFFFDRMLINFQILAPSSTFFLFYISNYGFAIWKDTWHNFYFYDLMSLLIVFSDLIFLRECYMCPEEHIFVCRWCKVMYISTRHRFSNCSLMSFAFLVIYFWLIWQIILEGYWHLPQPLCCYWCFSTDL